MTSYWDSLTVESVEENWDLINQWLIFHTFIFNDSISLDWYESEKFNDDSAWVLEGDCNSLYDYTSIANKIYFPGTYSTQIDYQSLYRMYKQLPEADKDLIRSYLHTFSKRGSRSPDRSIRDSSFLKILVSFTLIEKVIGDVPLCEEKVTCTFHGTLYKHNELSPKDWIKQRLADIVPDATIAAEYLAVVLEVRKSIRHKVAHEGAVPQARFIEQEMGEIVYDWLRTSAEWKTNSAALLSLKLQIDEIARYLLLNKIFGLTIFPQLLPLRSIRITSGA